jgi:hypothetical protein
MSLEEGRRLVQAEAEEILKALEDQRKLSTIEHKPRSDPE